MKNSHTNRLGKLCLSALLILIISFSTACSDDDSGCIVAILRDNVNTDYWIQISQGIKAAAQSEDIDYEIIYTTSNEDYATQISAIEQLSSKYGNRLKGVILASVNAEVEAAAAKLTVPIVIVDTQLSSNSPLNDIYHCSFSTDNYSAGAELAYKIETAASNILIVKMENSNSINKRVTGFLSEKGEASVIEVPDDDCSETIKENLNGIKTIFAANGSTATFAIKAVADRSDITIYAFDSNETILSAIRNGSIVGTMAQDTYNMGFDAVKSIFNSFVDRDCYLSTYYIDAKNIDEEEAIKYINKIPE